MKLYLILIVALTAIPAASQDVAYCRHGQTGEIIVIQAGYACPMGYYRI